MTGTFIKQVLQDINAGKFEKKPYQHDNRPYGAIWPQPEHNDLPDTDWYVKDYS